MKRGILLSGLLLVAAGAGVVVLRQASVRKAPLPAPPTAQLAITRVPARHVVMISMDTSRADHFGFLGNDWISTPRLDALAGESIVLTDFMTVVPTTLASHTSLFTGRYPHHHGVPRNGFIVHDDNVMLPEVLKSAGFETAGFVAAYPLDSRFGFAQGFDFYDDSYRTTNEDDVEVNERAARDVTDSVIRYLDENGVANRLFLFVHYFDPHRPYAPPPPFDAAYDQQARENLPDLADLFRPDSPLTENEKQLQVKRHTLQYAGEISAMDEQIGRLLDDLRSRGVLDSALTIVTSDHGENFLEHPDYFNHGQTVYQTVAHSVGIIRLPYADRAGTRLEGLMANIDIFPTVLGMLGIEGPSPIDGVAFDPSVAAKSETSRARFCEATKPRSERLETAGWANARKARSIRKGRFKLIQTPYHDSEELYDLTVDPGETNNLLDAPTSDIRKVAGELRRELEAWGRSADPLPVQPSASDETLRRLRSLGYINE